MHDVHTTILFTLFKKKKTGKSPIGDEWIVVNLDNRTLYSKVNEQILFKIQSNIDDVH